MRHPGLLRTAFVIPPVMHHAGSNDKQHIPVAYLQGCLFQKMPSLTKNAVQQKAAKIGARFTLSLPKRPYYQIFLCDHIDEFEPFIKIFVLNI